MQVLHFTGLSFPPSLQLQLAVLDPRRLAPAEVLSVLSWCLPHTLVSLRLGTVRSAAPGDVLVLLGTLTGLQSLSLQVGGRAANSNQGCVHAAVGLGSCVWAAIYKLHLLSLACSRLPAGKYTGGNLIPSLQHYSCHLQCAHNVPWQVPHCMCLRHGISSTAHVC